jgi:hypothetical protein
LLCIYNKTGIHGRSAEQRIADAKKAACQGNKINRELEKAIYNPEVRKRQHVTLREKQVSAYYDPVLRQNICSKGGKNGPFSKVYYEKQGLTEEDRIEAQRQRGKKGGPRNRGFKWYNDGKKYYKYTVAQQEKISFDQFIKTNSFSKGKLPNNIDKIWVNDGNKNYMIPRNEFDGTNYQIGRLGDKKKYGKRKSKNNQN